MTWSQLTGTLALAAALTGCAPSSQTAPRPAPTTAVPSESSPPPSSPAARATQPVEALAGSALAALATLPVKGRAAKTGYDREAFGQRWADVDRDGCDTRNDILARDLQQVTYKQGTNNCKVLTGVLVGPYTGRTISFDSANASEVQVDHVVALSDAWQKGAQQWDAGKRTAFANDPLNLLAVDGAANSSKSDGDAATWLPPNKAFRCPMVARQVAVKAKYGLWITPAEHDAIARVLADCPNESLPAGDAPTTVAVPEQRPAPPPPAAPAQPPADSGTDPDYGSCKNAKANGAGPYTRGEDPEYDYYRDGDSDGVVCE